MRQRMEEEERKLRSEKAYKRWKRLRKSNKYRSKVDNKTHDLPAPKPLQHEEKWRQVTTDV